jgi:hypothetical protein
MGNNACCCQRRTRRRGAPSRNNRPQMGRDGAPPPPPPAEDPLPKWPDLQWPNLPNNLTCHKLEHFLPLPESPDYKTPSWEYEPSIPFGVGGFRASDGGYRVYASRIHDSLVFWDAVTGEAIRPDKAGPPMYVKRYYRRDRAFHYGAKQGERPVFCYVCEHYQDEGYGESSYTVNMHMVDLTTMAYLHEHSGGGDAPHFCYRLEGVGDMHVGQAQCGGKLRLNPLLFDEGIGSPKDKLFEVSARLSSSLELGE